MYITVTITTTYKIIIIVLFLNLYQLFFRHDEKIMREEEKWRG